MTKRGMNMRDMKAEQMGKRPRGRPPKKPPATPGSEPPRGEQPLSIADEDAAELDQLAEAVHVAQSDGQFAPTTRYVRDAEDERDCPDEPPPGWGDG